MLHKSEFVSSRKRRPRRRHQHEWQNYGFDWDADERWHLVLLSCKIEGSSFPTLAPFSTSLVRFAPQPHISSFWSLLVDLADCLWSFVPPPAQAHFHERRHGRRPTTSSFLWSLQGQLPATEGAARSRTMGATSSSAKVGGRHLR